MSSEKFTHPCKFCLEALQLKLSQKKPLCDLGSENHEKKYSKLIRFVHAGPASRLMKRIVSANLTEA